MAELAENEPVHSLLSWMKNNFFLRDCVFAFGRMKVKTGILLGQGQSYIEFLDEITYYNPISKKHD